MLTSTLKLYRCVVRHRLHLSSNLTHGIPCIPSAHRLCWKTPRAYISDEASSKIDEAARQFCKEDSNLLFFHKPHEQPIDIYDTLLLRRSERNTTSPPSTNRLLNNLCAIQGPSGTGKTFLLNQILQSQHKEPPLEDIQLRTELKKGKYLAVTFGSDITSVVTSDITEKNREYLLAARIFTSYFKCENVTVRLERYFQEVDISPDDMVRYIIRKHGALLLVVDEIQRCGAHALFVLNQIYTLLSLHHCFHAVVTTLDALMLLDPSKTPSDRPIVWTSLHRPTFSDVVTFFKNKGRVPGASLMKLIFAGAHWRSVELLEETITELESEMAPNTPDMQTLISKFSSRFGVDVARSTVHEIPYEIVRDALSSKRSRLYDYKLMFDGKPFAYWAANLPGIVNSVTMSTLQEAENQMPQFYHREEVPLLTPMTLKFWMSEESNQRKYPELSAAVLEMLNILTIAPPSEDKLGEFGATMETLYAYWQQMMRALLQGQTTTLIDHFSRGELKPLVSNNTNFEYIIKLKTVDARAHEHFTSFFKLKDINAMEDKIYLFGGSSPAFDVFYVERDAEGTYWLIFVETRFGGARDLWEMNDKLEKFKAVHAHIASQLQDSVEVKVREVVVFANLDPAKQTTRTDQEGVNDLAKKHDVGVMVISSKLMRALLGPTLEMALDVTKNV